jgi:hypothetical protein
VAGLVVGFVVGAGEASDDGDAGGASLELHAATEGNAMSKPTQTVEFCVISPHYRA